MEPVHFYESKFYMFSNFASFSVRWEWSVWMTSEHAYQAAKFEDGSVRRLIHEAKSAYEAKEIALAHAKQVRGDWSVVKLGIMESIVRAKLDQHPIIREKLVETADRTIVENSPVDSYWGTGPTGNGENRLGKIWMKLRDELLNP